MRTKRSAADPDPAKAGEAGAAGNPAHPEATPGARRFPPARTLGAWRRAARAFLGDLETPAAEADHIAAHVLGLSRLELTLHTDRALTRSERRRLSRLIHKRKRRIPLQVLLGEVDFAGVVLRVRPGVFIPRPETEGLAERAAAFLHEGGPSTAVDVGTGTGAVALALAAAVPGLQVWATDRSPRALRLARENARRLGLGNRVRCFRGDLLEPVARRRPPFPLRAVVCNPPYIAPGDRGRLPPEVVDHEPHEALFAEDGGLAVIRRLLLQAARILPAGGLLALEIGEDQGRRVAALLTGAGLWEAVRIERDLAGKERYALALRGGGSPPGTGGGEEG